MTGAVLVTGANGFVGMALCRYLLAQGRRVVGAVRDPGAALPACVERCIVPEIGPDTDWNQALSGVGSVVHLAARVHVPGSGNGEALEEFRRVNAYGAATLARAAANRCIQRFIFISSVKVLGDENSDGSSYVDTDIPLPVDAYGRSKLEGEEAVAAVSQGGMTAVILRPPLVYGPGVRANFLAFLGLCDTAITLPLGGIDNRRSLLALDNLVAAIAYVLDQPGAAGGRYLLKDGEDLSIGGLAARLRKALGRPERIWQAPPRLLGALNRIGPLSPRLKRLTGSLTVDDRGIRALGFAPPIGVDEGLARVARWWRAR